MVEFGDVTAATRMRDVISRMVRETVDTFRPPDRYGRVLDVNRFTGQASVLLNGDSDPITIRMTTGVQPMFSDANAGTGKGSMVLVGGSFGNYWVKQIISGQAQSIKQGLAHPRLIGGSLLQSQTANYDTVGPVTLQAIGNTTHFGRWDNTNSFGGAGVAYLEVVLKWTFFTGNIKTYQVPVRNGATGGVWMKLSPVTDSGDNSGNDFELEIMTDNNGFELRARRMAYFGGGLTPGGMSIAVWTHGDQYDYVAGSALGEEASTVPTKMFGTDAANFMKGPFLSPGNNFPVAAQDSLSGGSDITYDGVNVNWTVPFTIATLSRNQYLPGGFIDIPMAAASTGVPVYGGNSTPGVRTSSAAGLGLNDGEALYCEPNYGDTSTTTAPSSSLKLVLRTVTDRYFEVPSHWVLLAFIENGRFCCVSRDDTAPRVHILQSVAQTGWTTATYTTLTFSGTDTLDTHDMHNPASNNSRVVIGKRLGWYKVWGSYNGAANANTILIRAALMKNGSRIAGSGVSSEGASPGSVSAGATVPVTYVQATAATDYVEIQGWMTASAGTIGSNVGGELTSTLSAEWVRS